MQVLTYFLVLLCSVYSFYEVVLPSVSDIPRNRTINTNKYGYSTALQQRIYVL